MKTSGYLLDTNIWLNYILGIDLLSDQQKQIIETASQNGQLFLCPISILEIAKLEQSGSITFRKSSFLWFDEALEKSRTQLTTLTTEILVDSCNLPSQNNNLSDNDRIIIATSRILDLKLVTNNYNIIDYSKTKHIKILDATT